MEMTSSIYLLPILSPGARPCLEAVGKFSRVLKPFSCQKWPWTERREGSGLEGGAQPVSTGGGSEPNSGDAVQEAANPVAGEPRRRQAGVLVRGGQWRRWNRACEPVCRDDWPRLHVCKWDPRRASASRWAGTATASHAQGQRGKRPSSRIFASSSEREQIDPQTTRTAGVSRAETARSVHTAFSEGKRKR